MDDGIRVLNTSGDDLEACNTRHLVRLFGGISSAPDKAMLLRGKVSLGFPSVESDPRPNWSIPVVRQFVRSLNGQLPHFPYFLIDDRSAGQIMFYLLCLVDVHPGPDGAQSFAADRLLQIAQGTVASIYEFCRRIQDDGDIATEALLLNLPVEILTKQPELARKALGRMRPTLEAVRQSFQEKPRWFHTFARRQVRQMFDGVLADAAALAGLDARGFESDEALVEELLRRTGRA